jgi:hypothetical protein
MINSQLDEIVTKSSEQVAAIAHKIKQEKKLQARLRLLESTLQTPGGLHASTANATTKLNQIAKDMRIADTALRKLVVENDEMVIKFITDHKNFNDDAVQQANCLMQLQVGQCKDRLREIDFFVSHIPEIVKLLDDIRTVMSKRGRQVQTVDDVGCYMRPILDMYHTMFGWTIHAVGALIGKCLFPRSA